MRHFRPSGFIGGLCFGLLIALFAVGDLARMASLVTPAAAQSSFAPAFRIMDGAHTQLAAVDHIGALSVSLSGSSGGGISVTHVQSVTHISGRVILQNVAGTAVTLTGTSLDVNCTGCSAASVVNVAHVSAMTHIAGAVSLINRAGTYVTITGTALDVNCTGCAAASVVAVSHVSGAVHVVNSFGAALHIQGLGTPGQSHGGVLSIQGVNNGNAVAVGQSLAAWNIAHITGAVHLAGNVVDQNNSALRVTGVTVFTVMGAIDHISSVTHVRGGVFLTNQAGAAVTTTSNALDVNCTGCSSSATVHISAAVHLAGSIPGARIHIQGVGTAGNSHGGVLSIQGVAGGNSVVTNVQHISSVVHVAGILTGSINVDHVTSVTHIFGRVGIISQAGTYVTVTGTALDVNCTGCSAASVVGVTHNSGALHVAGTIKGAQFHVTGLGTPGQTHGGVFTVQGVTGMIPMDVQQGAARWTVAHITSVTHVTGGVFLTSQAGAAITVTGTALDVNCTGCAAASVVAVSHNSGSLHVAGTIKGAQFHVTGLGLPGQTHGGVFTIQGVTGMIPVDVSQSVARWTIAHVTSVTHVYGTVSLVARDGTYATFTSTSLNVNCTAGCGSGDAVNVFHQSTIRHISSVVHVVGFSGAALHMQGIGLPGAAHGGVVSIQGVGGMVAVSVAQAVANWTVAHVTSVTHVYGTVSLVSRAGAYASFTGTSLDVNCTAGCSGGGTISHITSFVHVVGYAGAALHMQGIGLPGAAHGGVVSIQGVGGMVAVSVAQAASPWTVAHITSVTHVYGTMSLVARDGTYAGFSSGAPNLGHISGVIHVNVVSSSHLSGAIHVSGISNIGSGAPGTYTTQMVCHSSLAVHVAASAPGLTQIIHLTSTNNNTDQTSWRIYICGIVIISAHAQGFSLYEGTGTTCVTGKRPLMGAYRPDDSMILAGNGGFSAVAPFPWMSTQNPGNNLCIGQTTRTSGGTISGVITYRAGP